MMTKHDWDGKEYAQIAKVRKGNILEVDEGFGCLGEEGGFVLVKKDKFGLYFNCKSGRHYLQEQDWGDGYLCGMYHVTLN